MSSEAGSCTTPASRASIGRTGCAWPRRWGLIPSAPTSSGTCTRLGRASSTSPATRTWPSFAGRRSGRGCMSSFVLARTCVGSGKWVGCLGGCSKTPRCACARGTPVSWSRRGGIWRRWGGSWRRCRSRGVGQSSWCKSRTSTSATGAMGATLRRCVTLCGRPQVTPKSGPVRFRAKNAKGAKDRLAELGRGLRPLRRLGAIPPLEPPYVGSYNSRLRRLAVCGDGGRTEGNEGNEEGIGRGRDGSLARPPRPQGEGES
jgi:hypothetical protein